MSLNHFFSVKFGMETEGMIITQLFWPAKIVILGESVLNMEIAEEMRFRTKMV